MNKMKKIKKEKLLNKKKQKKMLKNAGMNFINAMMLGSKTS